MAMMESNPPPAQEPDSAFVNEAVSGLMTLLTKQVPSIQATVKTQAAPVSVSAPPVASCNAGAGFVAPVSAPAAVSATPRYCNTSDPMGFSVKQGSQMKSAQVQASPSLQQQAMNATADVPGLAQGQASAHEYQVFSHAVQSALASYRSASLIQDSQQQQVAATAALNQGTSPLHSLPWPTMQQMGTLYQSPAAQATEQAQAPLQVQSQAQFIPPAAVAVPRQQEAFSAPSTRGSSEQTNMMPSSTSRSTAALSRAQAASMKPSLQKALAVIEATSCSDNDHDHDSGDVSTCSGSEKSSRKPFKKRSQAHISLSLQSQDSASAVPRTGEDEILFKRARNRLHAQKSREKKRSEVVAMRCGVQTLKRENSALKTLLIREMGKERAEAAFQELSRSQH